MGNNTVVPSREQLFGLPSDAALRIVSRHRGWGAVFQTELILNPGGRWNLVPAAFFGCVAGAGESFSLLIPGHRHCRRSFIRMGAKIRSYTLRIISIAGILSLLAKDTGRVPAGQA